MAILYGTGPYGGTAYGTGERTDGSWLPQSAVLEHLAVQEGQAVQIADAERCRLAAAAHVERVRPDLLGVLSDEDGAEVLAFAATPDVLHGALLYTARLYARKGSPGGLASFGEFGAAALPRFDADIERLLGVGRYGKPAIG